VALLKIQVPGKGKFPSLRDGFSGVGGLKASEPMMMKKQKVNIMKEEVCSGRILKTILVFWGYI
jgi:hypothetical protein